ncbi:MAG: alpha/beta hydrolase [Actinomycetota bacterium]
MSSAFRRPSWDLLALEQRAPFEFGAFLASSPLLRMIGRGDEHPVLVLPGFTASDASTRPLRDVLRSQGYWAHRWRLGRNLGPTVEIIEGMRARVVELSDRHQRPVSIVGWSLGGIYARALARGMPDRVRLVITLGSPFRMRPADRSNASGLYTRLRELHIEPPAELLVPEEELPPLSVPSSAIYSRTDGIVDWRACIDAPGPHRENIEVRGAHYGLGFNPAVVYAISDRLAQGPDDWRPFEAPVWLRAAFPRPAYWSPSAA